MDKFLLIAVSLDCITTLIEMFLKQNKGFWEYTLIGTSIVALVCCILYFFTILKG